MPRGGKQRNAKPPPVIKGPRTGATASVKNGGTDTRLRKPKKKPQGTPALAPKTFGKCGAKKKRGTGSCTLPAGFGTDHYGIGRCKYHAGATKGANISAVQQQARLMGAPIDMNPVEAVVWCIRITAGEVKWLSEEIAKLSKKDWHENTILGQQMHLYVRERRDRVSLLYKMGNDALKLGLAERAIRLAEMYGVALSRFIMGVLEDLELSPEQAQNAPSIVRKHLILLEGTKPVDPQELIGEAVELGEGEPPLAITA